MPNFNLWPIRQLAPIGTMTATSVSIAASVTSETILAANPARLYARFQNVSDTAMYIKLGEAASINQGIWLNVAGSAESSYEINQRNLYRGAINVAASANSKVIMITEGT